MSEIDWKKANWSAEFWANPENKSATSPKRNLAHAYRERGRLLREMAEALHNARSWDKTLHDDPAVLMGEQIDKLLAEAKEASEE